jgi:hypothetical protein
VVFQGKAPGPYQKWFVYFYVWFNAKAHAWIGRMSGSQWSSVMTPILGGSRAGRMPFMPFVMLMDVGRFNWNWNRIFSVWYSIFNFRASNSNKDWFITDILFPWPCNVSKPKN